MNEAESQDGRNMQTTAAVLEAQVRCACFCALSPFVLFVSSRDETFRSPSWGRVCGVGKWTHLSLAHCVLLPLYFGVRRPVRKDVRRFSRTVKKMNIACTVMTVGDFISMTRDHPEDECCRLSRVCAACPFNLDANSVGIPYSRRRIRLYCSQLYTFFSVCTILLALVHDCWTGI